MKIAATKIRFVQTLLTVLATGAILLGLITTGKTLVAWPALCGTISHRGVEQQIILGILPFTDVCNFVSFAFLFLLYEMYGFRSAFFTLIAVTAAWVGGYYTFELLRSPLVLDPNAAIDAALTSLVQIPLKSFLETTAITFSSQLLVLVFSSIIRAITRDYFMFLRYLIAGPIGLSAGVLAKTYLVYHAQYSPDVQLVFAATPLLQTWVLLAGTIVPLYLIRLPLGIFRGSTRFKVTKVDDNPKEETAHSEDEDKPQRSGLFKTKAAKIPPSFDYAESQPSKEDLPFAPPTHSTTQQQSYEAPNSQPIKTPEPVVNSTLPSVPLVHASQTSEHPEEDTVSQKIKISGAKL